MKIEEIEETEQPEEQPTLTLSELAKIMVVGAAIVVLGNFITVAAFTALTYFRGGRISLESKN